MFCWVCDNPVDHFLSYGLPQRPGRCPHCGAKPRYRAVIWYLREVFAPMLQAGSEVLEVGASGLSIRYYPKPRTLGRARYTALDTRRLQHHRLLHPPHRYLQGDISHCELPNGCCDLVLCNNTLPYIHNDREALAEIRRLLKPTGVAMLNTHTSPGPSMRVDEYRRLHPQMTDAWFAENGDQWVYGPDLLERIESAGLTVRLERLFNDRDTGFLQFNGLKADNEILLAFVDGHVAQRFG